MGCGKSAQSAEHVTPAGKITFHYFDVYGKGETARIILYYHGISFVDHRVQQQDWPALQSSGLAEFGALPVLEMDGHKMVESRAIARYLCRKFGYYPKALADLYMVESIIDLKEDVIDTIFPLFFKKDMEAINKVYTEDMPYWLKKMEDRLRRNGGDGWFVGKTVTLADFEIFILIWDYFMRPEMAGNYEHIVNTHAPKIKDFIKRFLMSSPKLKAYIDQRPSRPI